MGDQIGYLLGRFGGARISAAKGRVGRLWSFYEPQARRMFAKRAILAISAARFVSFVRTLMPWFAGMSRISYGRYVAFDLIGVLGWGLASVAAGYLAGESWRVIAGALGTTSAVVLVALIVALAVYLRRRRRSLAFGTGNGSAASSDDAGQTKSSVAADAAGHTESAAAADAAGNAEPAPAVPPSEDPTPESHRAL
jgi:hypothetical protein